MNKNDAETGLWRRLLTRRIAPPDAADMGTAFGLDYSLAQIDAEQPSTPPPPPQRRRGWMPRLVARRVPVV